MSVTHVLIADQMVYSPKAKLYKYTAIVLIGLMNLNYCAAQEDSRQFMFFQLDWVHSDPLDRFGELLDDRKLNGIELSLVRQFKRKDAWFAGASFSSATIDKVVQGITTTKSGYWDISAVLRHYPRIGFWRIDPYVQVMGGLRRLSTVTTIEWSADETELIPEDRSTTPIFGLGIGATVRLGSSIHLNLTTAYQSSGATTYLIATGNQFGEPIDNFEEVFSITNTLKYQLGLTFLF